MNEKKDLAWSRYLEIFSQIIAFAICISLLLAAVIIIFDAFAVLHERNIETAVQDALFVLILLEMFYITRSFIKYATINVGLVINVGIIAAVKEMIFKLDTMNWEMALAFGILFLSLAFVYFMEVMHYDKKK